MKSAHEIRRISREHRRLYEQLQKQKEEDQ